MCRVFFEGGEEEEEDETAVEEEAEETDVGREAAKSVEFKDFDEEALEVRFSVEALAGCVGVSSLKESASFSSGIAETCTIDTFSKCFNESCDMG